MLLSYFTEVFILFGHVHQKDKVSGDIKGIHTLLAIMAGIMCLLLHVHVIMFRYDT